MFLHALYKYNRWLFTAVVIFITIQLSINFKRGMVVTPFYHYGMYSNVTRPKASYEVFEVWVNGKRLQGNDFTPWQWDKIMLPLTYYSSIPASNKMFKADIQRLLGKLHLQPNEQQFLSLCDYKSFENWYKTYLGKIINQPVNSINLTYRTYRFNAGVLQPTNIAQQLPDLCR